jgi:hypothetical protein
MELKLATANGQSYVEGSPGKLLIQDISGVTLILEFCFSNRVNRVLLSSENLAEEFFDLSTGMAGEILQKLRNYRARLAIVYSPDQQLNKRFSEMIAEESKRGYFRVFQQLDSAQNWLCCD